MRLSEAALSGLPAFAAGVTSSLGAAAHIYNNATIPAPAAWG